MRVLTIWLLLVMGAWAQAQRAVSPCPHAQPIPAQLRLPADLPVGEPVAFEKQILAYLNTLEYRKLGWCEDKEVRDTGPLMGGVGAIVHPAVKIYYSPEVSAWLLAGRRGPLPDGAVIIKEQFSPIPAARYKDISAKSLGCSNDWSIMIKNSKASRDGWWWGEVWNSKTSPMNFDNPYQYPNAGYGIYCLRCHASAANDMTFSSLANIKGAPGRPLQYHVDNSWMSISSQVPGACGTGPSIADTPPAADFPAHAKNAALQKREETQVLHPALLTAAPAIQKMPPETLDDILAPPLVAGVSPVKFHSRPPDTSLGFLTSSQCLGCHSGISGASLGPTMVLAKTQKTGETTSTHQVNVSPYGEWRWSPMGLAGRDPVFYSQLDSELAALPSAADKQLVVDTCMNCHGAMGKKSYAVDHPGKPFQVDFVYEMDQHSPKFKYGSMARDGISCQVCHRMAAPKDASLPAFLKSHINGNFDLTPSDQLNGPFQDAVITTYPMVQSLGVKPQYADYIKSPQMCGSCHTIILPVMDSPDKGRRSVEQATYVEWLNSRYRKEYGSVGATPKTCQDCHMPSGYVNDRNHMNVAQIQDKIAIVQDQTYPQAEHQATPEQMNVRYRTSGYQRHELLGTNGFLLQMFQKPVNTLGNNETLGVRTGDYMTGLSNGLQNASDNVVQQAQHSTAEVAITKWEAAGGKLIVDVTVTNLAGHRFPSGVGFRRAFLELRATVDGKPIFTSGTTDEHGQITDAAGVVLPTESFADQQYQPHFSQARPITSSAQVQIYEELVEDVNHKFTTGFTRRDYEIKDNRLLPAGWQEHGPADMPIPEPYLEATHPKGEAAHDPVYLAGNGQSVVRYEIVLPAGVSAAAVKGTARLYSQTMPPYFLQDRGRTKTPATDRLMFLTGALGTLKDTDYVNWKLLVGEAKR